MTTIEHLAIINLRLAQKCAKKDDFIESMKRTVAAHIAKSSKKQGEAESAAKYSMGCAERSEKARVAAEAKLADAERRLAERGLYDGIAADFEKCRHQRDAEKARADALQTTEAEIRHLRNEVERLRNDYLTVADAVCRESKSPEDCARQARETRADNERLRGILGWALDRLSAILCGPDDKCRIDGSPADRAIVDDALRELREADAPPKRRLPADHKCVLCHGTGYYGDNGPGIKGNSEYQPCGCTMREADAPPHSNAAVERTETRKENA